MEEYPSNSISPKVRRPIPEGDGPETPSPVREGEKKEIKKVVTGKAIKRRKGLGERLLGAFASEGKNIGQSIIDDILKPALRDTISEAIIQGVQRAVYGEVQPNNTRRTNARGPVGNSGPISYNRYSTPGPQHQRDISPRARAAHNFQEIEVSTRAEGQAILRTMDDCIRRYGSVSVSDLYEMTGLESEFTDEKWGWTDLFGSDVRRNPRSGNYALILPPTEAV